MGFNGRRSDTPEQETTEVPEEKSEEAKRRQNDLVLKKRRGFAYWDVPKNYGPWKRRTETPETEDNDDTAPEEKPQRRQIYYPLEQTVGYPRSMYRPPQEYIPEYMLESPCDADQDLPPEGVNWQQGMNVNEDMAPFSPSFGSPNVGKMRLERFNRQRLEGLRGVGGTGE